MSPYLFPKILIALYNSSIACIWPIERLRQLHAILKNLKDFAHQILSLKLRSVIKNPLKIKEGTTSTTKEIKQYFNKLCLLQCLNSFLASSKKDKPLTYANNVFFQRIVNYRVNAGHNLYFSLMNVSRNLSMATCFYI